MSLKAGDSFETLEGEILSVGNSRNVPTKYGKTVAVATASFKSEQTGIIELALWAENIVKVKAKDKVRLCNVEVRDYRGKLNLSIAPPSKGGSIERL